ncbi:hypothetical protein B0J14DRAFT_23198 [Halenospora varia]|nr:hypothetical protein B0J14DRAFT_23198 [Halenospora varia]
MSYTRSVLVTGGTAGLGYHAALTIARQHPEYQIVVSSRTDPNNAATTINNKLEQKNVMFLPLDLADLSNVRTFVTNWESKKFPPIQHLLLNAALQFPHELRLTDSGVEATFAISHVGHALLFHLLYKHLADNARIAITSSGTHDPAQNSGLPDAKFTTAEDLAHPPPDMVEIDGRQRYASSKLANILWGYALNRRLDPRSSNAKKRVSVVLFDPGLMPGTGLAREYSAVLRFIWKSVMTRMIPVMRLLMFANIHTPKESGENLAKMVLSTDASESGLYFEGTKKIPSSVDSYDEKKQENLWVWTVETVATTEQEKAAFNSLT